MRKEGVKNGERIKQIRDFLAQGKSRNEIALILGISRQAIYDHLKRSQKRVVPEVKQGIKNGVDHIQREKKRYIRDWRVYNEALVKRGEFLLDLSPLEEEKARVQEMNKGKKRWVLLLQRYPDRDMPHNANKIQVRLSEHPGTM